MTSEDVGVTISLASLREYTATKEDCQGENTSHAPVALPRSKIPPEAMAENEGSSPIAQHCDTLKKDCDTACNPAEPSHQHCIRIRYVG